eukprot:GHRR01002805.1.p1 GENE.GHRR01002805.1~~GHRR01002805.1.p1  ORF type:complete len:312 (+),score=60.59 GHRR01002805.1:150-1085(+)
MNYRTNILASFLGLAALSYILPATPEIVAYGTKENLWRGEIIQLAWEPRAYHLKGLLTDEECDHIKAISQDQLTASDVVNSDTGKSERSQVRTSTGTFFNMGHDDVITRIEERVADVTMLPRENQEGLQVLKYVDGQKYEPHHDYFHDVFNKDPARGGQRVVTVLMYLATPEEGGETVFPDVDPSLKVEGEGWSDCAKNGLAHKPKKGDALMFYSLTPDGVEDPHSLHGSCPTTKGEKWSATKWIHVDAFGQDAEWQKDKWKGCSDNNENCVYWAGTGECGKNPAYMHMYCKLSCRLCDASAASAGVAPAA